MHPCWETVENLERFHKRLRLGWDGARQTFGLIQLYHTRDFKRTFLEPWGDRGPIYGTRFDPLVWHPIYVIDVDVYDVFDGSLLGLVREWAKSPRERFEASERAAAAEMDRRYSDIAGEMGERIWHNSQRHDSFVGKATPYKTLTKRDKDVLSGDYDKSVARLGGHTGVPMR